MAGLNAKEIYPKSIGGNGFIRNSGTDVALVLPGHKDANPFHKHT
tara:strand:+ start:299 stop:433 length:135 start_codon:yes stop_codon:yes gene_type:complete